MPKMQGVVHNLRRSVTVSKQQKHAKDSEKGNDDDRVGLLRTQSVMSRTSMTSTKSGMSTGMGIMTVGEEKRL